MRYRKAANIFVGFLAAMLLLGGLPALAQVLPSAPVPPGYTVKPIQNLDRANDQIIQLNNLTVQSVSGTAKPGMIYASDDHVIYCLGFRSTEGNGFRAPCPSMEPNALYQISVADDTIILFSNRRRASMADIAPGDRINVFGFLDPDSGLLQALIVRDLSKSGVRRGYYTQINNLRVVSAPSSPYAPATLTATPVNPCGDRVPCTLMGMLYTINVNQNTQILNAVRQPLDLSAINAGDIINVYGWYAGGTFNALVLRDLTANGAIINPPVNPAPVISGVSGPTTLQVGEQGTWTVNASDPSNGNLTYSVDWGDAYGTGRANSGSASIYPSVQQAATFTHIYQNMGTYTPRFTVTNSIGQSATVSLTVIVSGITTTGGPITISSLSPTFGPAGTQVTVMGSGFSLSGNIVHFEMSGMDTAYLPNISSTDGAHLSFVAPSYSSYACFYTQYRCLIASKQLGSGTYSVWVENANGISNRVSFALQSYTAYPF